MRVLAFLIVAAVPLIPDPPRPFERNAELDIELVRAAEVRYRGITASFDELTRAYALTAYEGATVLGWEAHPNPMHPDTETLVACRFAVAGARLDSAAGGPGIPDLRRRVGPSVAVTWRLNTVAEVRVDAHDEYATDALDVYRHTVDRMLGRMLWSFDDLDLLVEPGGAVAHRVAAGTVLMQQAERDGWAHVRVPADTTAGWVRLDRLRPVSGQGGAAP